MPLLGVSAALQLPLLYSTAMSSIAQVPLRAGIWGLILGVTYLSVVALSTCDGTSYLFPECLTTATTSCGSSAHPGTIQFSLLQARPSFLI